jgi:dynamin 1-like protein
MGIRRLIEQGLDKLHDPTMQCVRGVDRVLQTMVRRSRVHYTTNEGNYNNFEHSLQLQIEN